jgi:hypothetical protein
MPITELQKQVDVWIKKYGVRYFNELTNMAILTEEVGEVARIIARRYGEQSEKESDKKLFIKLGIVFWSVPTRNFILVFSLIMQYPAAIVYYTCFPGTYFTLRKAWSLVEMLKEK